MHIGPHTGRFEIFKYQSYEQPLNQCLYLFWTGHCLAVQAMTSAPSSSLSTPSPSSHPWQCAQEVLQSALLVSQACATRDRQLEADILYCKGKTFISNLIQSWDEICMCASTHWMSEWPCYLDYFWCVSRDGGALSDVSQWLPASDSCSDTTGEHQYLSVPESQSTVSRLH